MRAWTPTTLGLSVFMIAACREPPVAAPAVVDSVDHAREEARDRARLVLEKHCGQCHIRSYDTALPGALAVFDLSELEWHLQLTPARIESMRLRLDQPLPPDGQELMPEPERAAVRGFLALLTGTSSAAGLPD